MRSSTGRRIARKEGSDDTDEENGEQKLVKDGNAARGETCDGARIMAPLFYLIRCRLGFVSTR